MGRYFAFSTLNHLLHGFYEEWLGFQSSVICAGSITTIILATGRLREISEKNEYSVV